MKRALVLGVTGQDGSYLAELLLKKGYEVHGMIRRSATGNTCNIDHFKDKLVLHQGDLSDHTSLYRIISNVQPNELYNEADQDHVGHSKDTPAYSCDVTAKAIAIILASLVDTDNLSCKVFQPLSSTMFGEPASWPQTEETQFDPQSPYACAKVAAYYICRYYRKQFDLFVSTGILYNHTSERQTEDYLLPKICRSAVRIARGEQEYLAIGNLEDTVDIGYAPEYMEAAWTMLQQDEPDDFIISSWNSNPIERFVEIAFGILGIGMDRVIADEKFFKPTSNIRLVGNHRKASDIFNFHPKIRSRTIVARLINFYQESLK